MSVALVYDSAQEVPMQQRDRRPGNDPAILRAREARISTEEAYDRLQDGAVSALAKGASISALAHGAGITRGKLYRWQATVRPRKTPADKLTEEERIEQVRDLRATYDAARAVYQDYVRAARAAGVTLHALEQHVPMNRGTARAWTEGIEPE